LSFLDRSSTAPFHNSCVFFLADDAHRHRQCPSCWHGRRLAVSAASR
jgi:hypothetical protein